MTRELQNELRERVEQIRSDRLSLVNSLRDLLYSDNIFIGSEYRLKSEFRDWLVKQGVFTSSIIREVKKKRKLVKEKFYTDEYKILISLRIRDNDAIEFYNGFGVRPRCPYTNGKSISLIELNGEHWIKYEMILRKIKEAIPAYQQDFYKDELNRLCDKQYSEICEGCGSKNEKCALYCNICGKKLKGEGNNEHNS